MEPMSTLATQKSTSAHGVYSYENNAAVWYYTIIVMLRVSYAVQLLAVQFRHIHPTLAAKAASCDRCCKCHAC